MLLLIPHMAAAHQSSENFKLDIFKLYFKTKFIFALVCQQIKVKLIILIGQVFLVCALSSSSCNSSSAKETQQQITIK